jgi:hypothetical protein
MASLGAQTAFLDNRPEVKVANQGCIGSGEHELTRKERFRVSFGRSTFHSPKSRQSAKDFGIEPLLGTLAPEV